MRQRTTWKQAPRSASTSRRADDIYTMNRDGGNPQPAVNEYENGNPSTWAEDVNSGASVEKEYANGAVKRNEVGFPEFREDTWAHAGTRPWGKGGQYDNTKLASIQRKAAACEQVARAILRTSNEKLIEETALDLMDLPTKSLVATIKRMSQLSPASLPENSRFRRALACTKLSALLLSEEAEESAIERLASLFNSIDDMTLKGILNVVAASRVAEETEKEEEEKEEKTAASSEEKKEEKKEDEGVLTESDLEQIREIMKEVEAEEEKEEKGEEASSEEEEGEDDLENLFGGEEEGEEAEEAEEPQKTSSSQVEISFDDDEEEEGAEAVPQGQFNLSSIFDTDESLAQRELRSAQASNKSRTASAKGVKKLGQIKAHKASIEDNLESLWERPGH